MEAIREQEFNAGVSWWRTMTAWPSDFHNADYEVLAARNPNGNFVDEWWSEFLPRLTVWKALRPYSREVITAAFNVNRGELTDAWHQACGSVGSENIGGVTWEQVQAFPDVVGRLKPTRAPSPVFVSKFCHFLLPTIFPVVDNEAVNGSRTYEGYFKLIKGTWQSTPDDVRTGLIDEMTRLVEEGSGTVYAGFPFATKITELALIGRKHGQRHGS